jgi:hypothetical protein
MPPRVSFMFLPERLIPDSFYQSSEHYQSFQRPEFKPYFLAMDEEGIWVTHVQRIVEANPLPQMAGPRPSRCPANHEESTTETQDTVAIDCVGHPKQLTQLLPDHWSSLDGSLVTRTSQTHFFENIMVQCAQRLFAPYTDKRPLLTSCQKIRTPCCVFKQPPGL